MRGGSGAATASGFAWAKTSMRSSPCASRCAALPLRLIEASRHHATRPHIIYSESYKHDMATVDAGRHELPPGRAPNTFNVFMGIHRGCGAVLPARTCATALAQPARAIRKGSSPLSSSTMRLSARASSRCAALRLSVQGQHDFSVRPRLRHLLLRYSFWPVLISPCRTAAECFWTLLSALDAHLG